MNLVDLPGYKRALARAQRIEETIRDLAFLPIHEEINGVRVKQFTLRHLVMLWAARSPFVCGGRRTADDVVNFLWLVSPGYNPEAIGRDEFFAHVINDVPNGIRFPRAIHRYLDRALLDSPPSRSSTGEPIGISVAAAYVHRLARAYSWRRDDILDLPMAEIFQYSKLIAHEQNPRAPKFNRFQQKVKRRALKRVTKARAN